VDEKCPYCVVGRGIQSQRVQGMSGRQVVYNFRHVCQRKVHLATEEANGQKIEAKLVEY